MTSSRTGISVAFVLLTLSRIGAASAAELEIPKPLTPAHAVKQSDGSNVAAKRVIVHHQSTRLAFQEDLRIPACSGQVCTSPLFLGVGY
jgi:hypothetical protein